MEEINTRWNTLNKKVRAWGGAVPGSSGVWAKEGVTGRELRLRCRCLTLQWGCFRGAGGPASGSAAGGPAALREVPGRPGAAAELAGGHRGAHLQPEASLCRVQGGESPDPRAEGELGGRGTSGRPDNILGVQLGCPCFFPGGSQFLTSQCDERFAQTQRCPSPKSPCPFVVPLPLEAGRWFCWSAVLDRKSVV